MSYTIENIPEEIDQALRKRAASERKSPEQVIIDALAHDLGVDSPSTKKRDLSDIAGTWVVDPETEAVLEEQGRIDPELWK